jgi:hypothetical protein
MKALVCHPGASWATHDVYKGVVEGLRAADGHIVEWRLDGRIERWHAFLHYLWRKQRREQKGQAWPKPSAADTLHMATTGLIERALEKHCTDLIVVSAMFLPPDKIELAKRAGLRVWLLTTETPYDLDDELRLAAMVDGVWTNERAAVDLFRQVTRNVAYLPHAWRSGVHNVTMPAQVAPCDVLFCGSYFPERVEWFEAIDWTGIDLHLYGTTELIAKTSPLRAYCKGGLVPNDQLAALAKTAAITINFFRRPAAGRVAESCNPRVIEMAAAGCCVVTDARPEVVERFGDSMPTFATPTEAAALIRGLLADPSRRRACADGARAAVADATWTARGQQMMHDLARWTRIGG